MREKFYLIKDDTERSEWRCYLFGASKEGRASFVPAKGREPNIIGRFFMRICFDCRWVKE